MPPVHVTLDQDLKPSFHNLRLIIDGEECLEMGPDGGITAVSKTARNSGPAAPP